MAHALRLFRSAVLPDAFAQIVRTALRGGLGARTRERDDPHHRGEPRDRDHHHSRAGPLDAATMCDLGLRREYQDYASSADMRVSAAGRLDRIADAARWGLPR